MYLKHRASGDLIEVVDVGDLVDPFKDSLPGRFHSGEELQEPASFAKADLLFPSGETLPRCWLDPYYRAAAPRR